MLAAWWLITATFSTVALDVGDEPPAEVEPFVPEGFAVLDFAIGDLDGDGREDVVLILKNEDEDDANADGIPRVLLLLVRQADGRLKEARRNDRLVPCRTCGGREPDPYRSLRVDRAGVTLSFAGAGRTHAWSDDYTFAYDVTRKDWLLDRERHESSGDEPGDHRRYSISRDELEQVTIEGFDLGAQRSERATTWRVAAERAGFYDQPDLKSRPRRQHLVKGDFVAVYRELRNFVLVEFRDGKREIIGFMRKTDLARLPPAR
jgi:hypothetical protein